MTTKIEKCPTCGADAIDRSEYWEAYPANGHDVEAQLARIRKEVRKYYLALDNRQHGGIAETRAFDEIQKILEMHWEQGETKKFIEAHPKLKEFYS